MSYILEALKKSQQERELGQVPTLDASGIFTEDKVPIAPNYWGLLAVGLASLAVVIALYAAFRAPDDPSGVAGRDFPESGARLGAASGSLERSVPDVGGSLPVSVGVPALAPVAPLVEAPGPKRSAENMSPSRPIRSSSLDESVYSDESIDPGLEEALQRQLQAETEIESEPVRPARRQPSGVPEDLIQDIEAFKQQVRREQGIPPPTKRPAETRIPSDPSSLRLTAQQQAQIPAYLMTVHVYDKDPAKRFVVINALKYREGDRTREGFWVERIDPEGAVLSYMGNLFFVVR